MRRFLIVAALVVCAAGPAQAQKLGQLRKADPYESTYRAMRERMKTARISLDFTDAPLDDVVQFVRSVVNVNILIDPEVFQKHSREELKVTLTVKDLSAASALDLLLSFHKLKRQYRNGVMIITTADRVEETTYLIVYDVRDLMFVVRDFRGPKIGLGSDTQSGAGAVFTETEEPENNELSSPERLLEIVKGNAAGSSWEDNPKCSGSIINGLLVINQTRAGHYEVGRLMNMLRSFR